MGLGISGSPGDLVSHLGSGKSYDSEGETDSIVKVKEKPELRFCMQTDDEPPKLQSEVSPMEWTHHWGPFPHLGLQITVIRDFPALFKSRRRFWPN